jgi:hypothetical protein
LSSSASERDRFLLVRICPELLYVRAGLQTGHTEGMRVLLAVLAVLVILILVLGIILDAVRFLFSVAMALIIIAVVVLLLRQLVKR